ncbi:MAG TPA: HEPN domain-containing protein [Candidatus Hydrogenedentes bacterium]|nr:HEPN domain-containing protein [Candidatus Hydrogenedentota bacterium]
MSPVSRFGRVDKVDGVDGGVAPGKSHPAISWPTQLLHGADGLCILSAMKKSLGYLPKRKRDELKRIASIIRDACDKVEMIVLFGSYARGDYREEADLDPNRKSGHASDYDILVVTTDQPTAKDGLLWRDVTARCDGAGLGTHARIMARDIAFVNIRLAEGQYFFSDIKKEGRTLYDSGNLKLARKRKLEPAEKKRIAQEHFDHWLEKAEFFLGQYDHALQKGKYAGAAFLLHQVAEASYKATLAVITNYIPNEHFLGALSVMAAQYGADFEDVFPRKTRQEDELFRLLDYAYIGGRYDPDYTVFKDQLEYLAPRVKRLSERAK